MDWLAFKPPRTGGIPFYPGLVEPAGSVDRALTLSTCVALTAQARGPFTRYVFGGLPRWSDVLPLSRHRRGNALAWIFDESPRGESPMDSLRRAVFRVGAVHHFHQDAVLESLVELLGLEKKHESGVRPGRVWWEGDVSGWKSDMVDWMRRSGNDGGHARERLYAALECLLDELHRDQIMGLRHFNEGGRYLSSYVMRRYIPAPGAAKVLPFLQYDVLWSDIRTLAGLYMLRPPSSSKDNVKLKSKLVAMMRKLNGAGIGHRDVLRKLRETYAREDLKLCLEDVIDPPDRILDACK